MPRSVQMLAVALIAGVTVAAFNTQSTDAQNAKKPAVIAVVDVQKVFANLKERDAVEADITQQTEALQKEATERAQKIKELEADLPLLAKDSKAWKETRENLERMAIEFKAWQEFKKRSLEREKVIRIQELYQKAIDQIGKVAERDGYDLVLFKDQTEAPSTSNQQQIAAIIQNRKLLYAAERMDITDQITQVLNNQFANPK